MEAYNFRFLHCRRVFIVSLERTGIFHLIVLHFIAPHRCHSFYKLKVCGTLGEQENWMPFFQ